MNQRYRYYPDYKSKEAEDLADVVTDCVEIHTWHGNAESPEKQYLDKPRNPIGRRRRALKKLKKIDPKAYENLSKHMWAPDRFDMVVSFCKRIAIIAGLGYGAYWAYNNVPKYLEDHIETPSHTLITQESFPEES